MPVRATPDKVGFGRRTPAGRRCRAGYLRGHAAAPMRAAALGSGRHAVSLQAGLVLLLLAGALVLLLSGRVRVDVVALLVLASLALTGILTPAEALSGFSHPAVVTIWAVFILSAGLARTGVGNLVGRQVLALSGGGELGLLLTVMLLTAGLSAFMSNVAVVALMLPVVMDVARSTGIPPARLLLPLAYAALLGGVTTLVGTPPNILVAEALGQRGLRPFGIFAYTPVGAGVLLAGLAFLATVGRRLLPTRDPVREPSDALAPRLDARKGRAAETAADATDLEELYELREQLFVLRVQPGSALDGRPLAESRIGAALGLSVLAVLREDDTRLAPEPTLRLAAGDRLLVQGRPDRLAELRGRRDLTVAEESLGLERLAAGDDRIAEARLGPECRFLGHTVAGAGFRDWFGINVLGVARDPGGPRAPVPEARLKTGDRLLVQGSAEGLEALRAEPGVTVSPADDAELYRLEERLLLVRVPPESSLVGRTLRESRLGEAFGLNVLGILRDGDLRSAPSSQERLTAGDLLMVAAEPGALETLEALRELRPERAREAAAALRSQRVGLVEAVLSPRSDLAGHTLRGLEFRERYGLSVLAILREGEVIREDIRDLPLRFGDALLLFGPAERLRLLGVDRDFLVLTRSAQREPRREKAPLAVGLLLAVLAPVVLGWVQIAIAAVAGAALMVLFGCLTMEEAYRDIEWRAVFLVAGLLPLGLAMEQTGLATLLAHGLIGTAGPLGPRAVLAGVFAVTALGSQVIPPVAVVVVMAPVVLTAADTLALSPHALMMGMAMAASASFTTPIAQPANLLVMGPAGYRLSDYVRLGLPLTGVAFAVTLVLTPIFFPLR